MLLSCTNCVGCQRGIQESKRKIKVACGCSSGLNISLLPAFGHLNTVTNWSRCRACSSCNLPVWQSDCVSAAGWGGDEWGTSKKKKKSEVGAKGRRGRGCHCKKKRKKKEIWLCVEGRAWYALCSNVCQGNRVGMRTIMSERVGDGEGVETGELEGEVNKG